MMKTITCYLFLALCISIILFQAFNPSWSNHLNVDLFVYKERALRNFTNNEYQPGALFFFITLSLFLPNNQSMDSLRSILFTVNILLIFLIAVFIQKMTRPENVLIIGLVILFAGPIIFFRFEPLAIALLIISLYYFSKNSYNLSVISLALASTVKVYPLIYLPYYLISIYRRRGLNMTLKSFLLFTITIFILVFLFSFFFNFSFSQLINSLKYHTLKPVGLEGFWSGMISGISLTKTGSLPPITTSGMTWGIASKAILLPMWFFDYFWILVLVICYGLFLKKATSAKLHLIFLLTLTTITIVFNKLSSPQYLLWFLLLLPLINFEKLVKKSVLLLVFILSITVAFLTQYIYPLNYSQFLDIFNKNQPNYLIYLFLLKDILFLIVLSLLFLQQKEEP